jgi:starch-binding outer membrane protein, SusD/RagB family
MNSIFKKTGVASMIALLLAGSTSCEDYLNMPSTSTAATSSVFTTVALADMTTLGSYVGLYTLNNMYYPTYGTDEDQSSEGTSGSKNCVGNYVYTTANVPSSEFNAHYTCIGKCNNCIKYIPLMSEWTSGTDEEKATLRQLVGENLAIRAMHYLDLIRYWGDVPYITLPQEDLESMYSSRTSRDTIYDGIIADLQQAVEYLPWYSASGNTCERFNKNSAYGILARTALYAAGYSLRWDLTTYAESSLQMAKRSDTDRITALYQIASDACEAVINQGENSLCSSFETLFRTYAEGTYYPEESMLEYAQYGTQNSTLRAGYTYGLRCNISSMFGKAEPLVYTQPTLYYDYSDGDTRRDVTLPNYEINASNQRIFDALGTQKGMGKWRITWKTSKATSAMYQDINVAILRYSDVLLMYAEAQNELNNGPTTAAIKAYEQVRTRAFGSASKIGTTPTGHDDFFTAIVKERKLELAFEGWRRTDLIRWNLLASTILETKNNLYKLANRTAPYDVLPVYIAYPTEYATSFQDTSVTLNVVRVGDTGDTTGYHLPAKYTVIKYIGYKATDAFVYNFARGLVSGSSPTDFTVIGSNNVELFPIAQTVMDVNTGLTGQQHPAYE